MSPLSKPSKVDALKRGLGTAAAPAASEDPAESWHGKRVSEMTDAEVQAMATGRRPRAEKPVRFTLDLDRTRHRFLKTYAAEIEADGAAEVMRALLDELRDDANLASRIRARVWEAKR